MMADQQEPEGPNELGTASSAEATGPNGTDPRVDRTAELTGGSRDAAADTVRKADKQDEAARQGHQPDRVAGVAAAAADLAGKAGGRAAGMAAGAAEAASTLGATAAGAGSGSSKGTGGASAAADPSKGGQPNEAAFDLLEKAFKVTDWGWKNKQGDDRELGRLSFVNAQNAWVAAAMEDPKRASEMWRKKTNRPPNSEMEQMLAEKQKTVGAKPQAGAELDGVSADLADLSKRRNLSEAKTRKTALRSSLGEWNIMRGDAQQRSEVAKRSRTNELLSPEANRSDDGLHLLKSFIKGFATHRERTQAKVEKHKAALASAAIRETQQELGRVSTDIKKFETELDVPMSERQSIGLVGKSRKAAANHKAVRLGIGAVTVAAKVTKKVAEKTAEVAKGAAIQTAALTSTPGSIDGNAGSAAYQQRMAAFRQFQQSRGQGPGI
jgi:predicted secreted protein